MLYLNIYLKVLFNKWVKCPFDSIFDTSFSFSFPLISLLSILEAKCPNIYQKRPLLLYEKMCYILSPISTEGNIFSPTSCMQCVVVQLGWQWKAIRDRIMFVESRICVDFWFVPEVWCLTTVLKTVIESKIIFFKCWKEIWIKRNKREKKN